MEEKKEKTPYATHTTLRVCILESGMVFSEDQILEIGKQCADAHLIVFKKRPKKIEIVENGRIIRVALYNFRFKEIINNILKTYGS